MRYRNILSIVLLTVVISFIYMANKIGTNSFKHPLHYYTNIDDDSLKLEAAKFLLEIASNMMEPAAMFLLGTYLYNGEFMEKDTVRAVSLFYESAKKGNARAMYEYSLYMSRNGVEKDSVLGTAVECMSKSAEDGFQQAMKWLLEYHDTRQEYSRAYVYAKKLYMLKDVYGTRYMADCYRHGRSVERDKRLAKDLYRDAAGLGCKESEKILQEW